jgi:acyl-coenzyme A thioesterase PaaI-like protein
VIDIASGTLRTLLNPAPAMGRPGGIVSAPTLMAMADHAAYAVVTAHLGPALASPPSEG